MAVMGSQNLRVLIADERRDHLALVAGIVATLGHKVVAQETDVSTIAEITISERPDVALVGLGLSTKHALDLIDEIVKEASCPVIALLSAPDPAYVGDAARRGIFAYIVDTTPEELQSAIDITLERFREYHSLQGVVGRRAVIEQAKGILMARNAIDGDHAFELLRKRSQASSHKLADIAAAIVESHVILTEVSHASDTT
jgi:AmiR/NasT family two-component response regulator